MKTAKAVIQGYVGMTTIDRKTQIIVGAKAFGQGQEQDGAAPVEYLLLPLIWALLLLEFQAGINADADLLTLRHQPVDGQEMIIRRLGHCRRHPAAARRQPYSVPLPSPDTELYRRFSGPAQQFPCSGLFQQDQDSQ